MQRWAAGQVGCPAHTTQVSADRLRGQTPTRAGPSCHVPVHASRPDPGFVCLPNTVLTIAEIGARPRQYGVRYASRLCTQGAVHTAISYIRLVQVFKYTSQLPRYPGAAHTRWHETRGSGLTHLDSSTASAASPSRRATGTCPLPALVEKEEGRQRPGWPGGVTRHGPLSFAWA